MWPLSAEIQECAVDLRGPPAPPPREAKLEGGPPAAIEAGAIIAAFVMGSEGLGDDPDPTAFDEPAARVLESALRDIGENGPMVLCVGKTLHWFDGQSGRFDRLQRQSDEASGDQRLALHSPRIVVALGAAAASLLMGRPVLLSHDGGRFLRWADGRPGLATIHPRTIPRLRAPQARLAMTARLNNDLRFAMHLARMPL